MAKRSKQIDTQSLYLDQLQYSFDLWNGTVKPGDLITIKTCDKDRVMVLIDFEFDMDTSESDATQYVQTMVTKYSKKPFELNDEQKKQVQEFSFKNFKSYHEYMDLDEIYP